MNREARRAILGRDFISMMKPLLGLKDVRCIRSITVTAHYNDVAVVDVEMIANTQAELSLIEEEPLDITTVRYEVEVRRIDG